MLKKQEAKVIKESEKAKIVEGIKAKLTAKELKFIRFVLESKDFC